ncbi:cupin domain-containing protein [Cohnella algarum]|uniref:cupin domain-containing protein n=1 Tax=Cohnella algarum TaxID=2044859 RepID=UPI00196768C4|nr:cupin domain-containing protein [Cohnella algarum]MBN2983969.1 cupin domain-containing protein [Cohnella algarum]
MKTVIPDLLAYETVFRFEGGVIDLVEIEPLARYKPVIHHKTDEVYVLIKGEISYYIDGVRHDFEKGDVFKVPRGVPHGFINFKKESAAILSILFPRYDPEDVVESDAEDVRFREDLEKLTNRS